MRITELAKRTTLLLLAVLICMGGSFAKAFAEDDGISEEVLAEITAVEILNESVLEQTITAYSGECICEEL